MEQSMKRHYSFILQLCCLLQLAQFALADDVSEIQQLNGFTMGTRYQIQIVVLKESLPREEITSAVIDLLAELDTRIFSTYAASSELSRFNQHGVNDPFIASPRMLEVLLLSQEIAQLSGGAFDVTVGPLVNLWGFGPTSGQVDTIPDREQIEAARESVGYQYLQIDQLRSEIRKTRDIYVDLSGIAKGYAIDQLAAYFDEQGVDSYFLEIGGELKIKGRKPGGESWVPAIEAPLASGSQVYKIFYNRGEEIAVAGSGDYRNYFEQAGIRYSHEIDPRTGTPINHNLAATYVIDTSAARADALATAYMILGLDDAKRLAESEGQAAYFISKQPGAEFDDYITADFARFLNDK
jgi:thiamine biosynthesis lipoprotein